MTTIKFTKMHGLGNDFMVIDGINQSFTPEPFKISAWGNRHFGIGFDQLLLVEKSDLPNCDFKYRIFNSNGAEVEQCGNGARCFAKFVYEKGLTDKKLITVETQKKIIKLKIQDSGLVEVNMGKPSLKFEDIPFIPHHKKDTHSFIQMIPITEIILPVICVNIGNPHAVIMVDNLMKTPVEKWGKEIECSKQFPQKTNVEFVEIIDKQHIKIRVHERETGETLACGTGACAAVVAGISMNLLDHHVIVNLLGGKLDITWLPEKDIMMVGPATFVFEGEVKI